jgi:hypothetical protein
LHFFEVLDDFLGDVSTLQVLRIKFAYLKQRKRGQKTNLEFLAVRNAVFLWADEVEKHFSKFIQFSEFLETSIGLRFCLAASSKETEILYMSAQFRGFERKVTYLLGCLLSGFASCHDRSSPEHASRQAFVSLSPFKR